jgi:hypothetical protein
VAQLGARLDGIEEVVGSNPIGSTIILSKGVRRVVLLPATIPALFTGTEHLAGGGFQPWLGTAGFRSTGATVTATTTSMFGDGSERKQLERAMRDAGRLPPGQSASIALRQGGQIQRPYLGELAFSGENGAEGRNKHPASQRGVPNPDRGVTAGTPQLSRNRRPLDGVLFYRVRNAIHGDPSPNQTVSFV